MDEDKFCCSVCLDVLKEPVTLPCGHNYCLACIRGSWDQEESRGASSCPQCRQSFSPRPVLVKNSLLAQLLEELRPSGLHAAPDALCHAGPEDVACDFCSGRKLKAVKSCLTCLASYCQQHLQPHHRVASFKRHQLVAPCGQLQENVCSAHGEAMKMFCRTDRQSICFLCSLDRHRDHDTASAAAERTERQRELEVSSGDIQQRIQAREEDVKLLQKELEAILHSADTAVKTTESIFLELLDLIQRKLDDVKQQIRNQQEVESSRVQKLQRKLEQEIAELKKRQEELKKLLHTEDDIQFLQNCLSLSLLSESTESSSIRTCPVRYVQDVMMAVSEVREKLQTILNSNVFQAAAQVDGLLADLQQEPRTREDFLKHWRLITLDPNTVNSYMALSQKNRKARVLDKPQTQVNHGDRFLECCQVLSREGLIERSYWEVQWAGEGVCIAVAYRNISRVGKGNDCKFGHNDRSWALHCHHRCFWHNNKQTVLTGPRSSRVGVYLDPRAGSLSFYDVSDAMTLLHRVQASFTQPLHVGLRLYYTFVDSVEFSEPSG